MKRRTTVLFLTLFTVPTSCIPVRIANKLQDYKTIKEKSSKEENVNF
ncbi:hypothetical protein LCGC14_0165590 [marine sediment metagenome]|uniref:Uncharacterized protein n=1 Tax=marine sediment metagenome TaxID=412755 RepID=A0A0F9UTW8_9ZZZZ